MNFLLPLRAPLHLPSWLLLVTALLLSTTASAGGLADRFRDFILGDEAQAKSALPGLDASARACLQCHDGSHAPPVAGRAAGSPLQIRGSQTLNHSIGMVYDQSVMRDPQGYKSRAALHPNIRFVDGQVSCVSCHQTRTDLTLAAAGDANPQLTNASTCTATRELATGGRRDRDLCMACHNK